MAFFKKKKSRSRNPFGIETGAFSDYELKGGDNIYTFTEAVDPQTGLERSGEYLGLTIPKKRFRLALAITLLIASIFTLKAIDLQIAHGEEYRTVAEGNRIRIQTVPAKRGIIYDRKGEILVENVSTFTATITAADLPEDETKRQEVIAYLAQVTTVPHGEIEAILLDYQDAPYEPVPIARHLTYESAMLLFTQLGQLPGVNVAMTTERSYATAQALSLSHVLGYMGSISEQEITEFLEKGYRRIDEIGRAGVEKTYEEILHGQNGKKIVEVNALGQEISILTQEESIDGLNLTLSIDAELQATIESTLNSYVETNDEHKASVVALDPNNGEVLALVSYPSYDSNDFSGGIDTATYQALVENPMEPLFPRATAGEFPSGSTFKPIVAAAALAEGIISEHTSWLSTGGISVSVWFFPDWRAGGHGITDVRKALADSVNTFFYIIGGGLDDFIGLGVARITEYAAQFGLGVPTGIDLPSEASGFLPSKEWKQEVKGERWYVGDTYHLAIGQGDILVTPIQMAMATAVFANGGQLITPHLLHSICTDWGGLDGQGCDEVEPEILDEQVVDPYIIDVIRSGLRQGVTSGSSVYLSGLPEAVAGKTGTAQVGGDAENHAWWTGFGPFDDPNIVLVVLVENGGEGSAVAVPIANQILYWWFTNR